MKKTLATILVLMVAGVSLISCGKKSTSSTQHAVSGIKFRALVSNSLSPSGGGNLPVLNILDASKDVLSRSAINLLGTVSQAGLMAVSPDLKLTMVFSPSGNAIAVIDNTTESVATVSGGTTALPTITLPGTTESMFIAKDNVAAYAAVPSAPITGEAPGAVVVMNLATGGVTATLPVAGAHYVVGSPDGNHVLVFSDNSDSITIITAILIGTSQDPRTTVTGFNRPVSAIFTDNTTAYIFNCGPECGGTTAGVAKFIIGSSGPSATISLSGATYGLLSGSTLYVAGTPPHTACDSGTSAPNCGTLNTVDISSMRVTTASPIIITDGYHDRMQISANGQLFIGARSCSNVNVSGGEVRGCLSIFNTGNGKVIIPPQIGDVTGVQPISGRNVVYVCQGGAFQIFDTTTDKLRVLNIPVVIVGDPSDVKLVDPP